MRCEAAQEHFSDYCDGTMLRAVRIPLESHLGECDRCRRELDELKHVWQVLDRMPLVDPPADFRAVVWQRIDADAKARAESRRLRVPSFDWRTIFAPRRLAWVGAAVAIVLLARIAIPGQYQRAWLGFFGGLRIEHNAGPKAGVVTASVPAVKVLGTEQEITIPLLYRGAPVRASVRLLSQGQLVSPEDVQLRSGEPVEVIIRAPAPSLRQPVQLQLTPAGDPSRAQTLDVPLP